MTRKIDRRELIKKAAIGSLALAALALPDTASASHLRGPRYFFLARSKAATIDGVDHRILLNGAGRIGPSSVDGGGAFVHFDRAAPVPRKIVSHGSWEAKRLISWNVIGTWGEAIAGIVEMAVVLFADFPAPAVFPATLKVVCNVGDAGLSTGQEEGFTLTIPETPFGPFVPVVPHDGLTLFTLD